MTQSAPREYDARLCKIAAKYIDCYVRQVNVIGGIQEADADRAYVSQYVDTARARADAWAAQAPAPDALVPSYDVVATPEGDRGPAPDERAREPYLGLATTKQLIDELAARADVSAINGEAWPSYWTAMPDALAKEPKP